VMFGFVSPKAVSVRVPVMIVAAALKPTRE